MLRSMAEAAVLGRRNIKKFVRVPILLFFALLQPLLFLLLFSAVFSKVADLPGFPYENYLQFLLPTIIGQTALNSAFQSGVGMVNDLEDGMLDKFLIAPIRRSSILLGKVLADSSKMVIQALIIIGIGFVMGARIKTGPLGVAGIVTMAVLFGVAWSGISNLVALRTRNAEATTILGILLTFPLMFLSTGFMPDMLLPDWLDTVAKFNPITYLIEALREVVNNGWAWGAIGRFLAVTACLSVVTLTAATRAFRKLIA